MQAIRNRYQLNMPKLGLGTWPMQGDECTRAVQQALEIGYRHIDTATAYENEAAVGKALAATEVAREKIHLTTKVWWDKLQPDAIRASLAESLQALRSEYVDLFLIHWPGNAGSLKGDDLRRALDTLAALRDEGKTLNIGVANFPLPLLRQSIEEFKAPIAAIQVEYHVLLDQQPLLDYAREHNLAFTAYCPLARGEAAQLPEIRQIAAKHGVFPSQVVLQWLLAQDNVAAIPKASGVENQRANLAALDIRLDDEDRALIAGLPKDRRLVSPDFAPQW
ncbi:2,5-diketo-D-gluconate reductase B [Pseudomonas flavescens]|uniref:2,5-diketo-D-gluconate reductase B n=1 Tax=Phytopseudomonas flavescens TaxID=29435 RepID=A0A1G7ZIV8_9GAMM|nr:aldo/keto reductase [Pseudomonas flavescens]SDH08653.1 2,5-diketo-D-gluconate reductase B [Pseudomonas flavescens]